MGSTRAFRNNSVRCGVLQVVKSPPAPVNHCLANLTKSGLASALRKPSRSCKRQYDSAVSVAGPWNS